MSDGIQYSLFTKPWKSQSLQELGELVADLGFDGIELPVRPGYQVEPETVRELLPRAAEELAKSGVRILSVAGPTDKSAIIACAEAGVPIIRTMAHIGDETYLEAEDRLRREYASLMPLLEECNVTIGVQNHCNRFVANAVALARLLQGFDPKYVAAVWDAAHEALVGTLPEFALDVIWPQLCMVNLKNGFWQRATGPKAKVAEWRTYWTSGRQGLCAWPHVVDELKRRRYKGVVCLTAEYSDGASVERLISEDLLFARELFA